MPSYGYELLECGYKFGAPSAEVEKIDTFIAKGRRCKKCGSSMHYEGYHNGTSYIALMVCNQCGNEVEF